MTKPRRWRAGAAALATCVGVWAPAAAADAGRQKAVPCAVCHGPQGLAVAPDAPHLAGQPALYLSTQLRAYRSGARRHEVMNVIAKPLIRTDIDDLAAWFSSLQISIRPAP